VSSVGAENCTLSDQRINEDRRQRRRRSDGLRWRNWPLVYFGVSSNERFSVAFSSADSDSAREKQAGTVINLRHTPMLASRLSCNSPDLSHLYAARRIARAIQSRSTYILFNRPQWPQIGENK
jgi:hypothetical protein